MSLSKPASVTSSAEVGATASPQPTDPNVAYSYSTSRIIRVTVAAGLIVLGVTVIVLFFRVSSWIRYHRSLRRQREIADLLQKEEDAAQYEVAAWSDSPGVAPLLGTGSGGRQAGPVGGYKSGKWKKKNRENVMRQNNRAGMNAYEVHEWQGNAG